MKHVVRGRDQRPRQLLRSAGLLATIGLISHALPISVALRNLVAAIVLVWLSGLAGLAWLPRQRFDLAISIVIAGGLALNVLVSTTPLIVDWYTPDRAAVSAGLLALGILAGRVQWKGDQ